MRNSPPTHRIRYVIAAAGSTTHSMQVMHRKRAAPRCPSTQTAAGAKSPCGRLLASERMLDGGVGAGRAGVVAHTSCQRCVSHSSCSRPVVGCQRACAASRATTGAQLGSGCACEPPHIRPAHSHIDTEQLASAAPSHSTSADKHPRTPTGGREPGAEGSLGPSRKWGFAGSRPSISRLQEAGPRKWPYNRLK